VTSGHFTSFPIDSIIIDRETRQRRELTGIDELAWSIQSLGLINPIVIERSGKLRAGERRLTAVKSLGWTHINVQYVDELNEAELQLLELEENVRRIELSWQDQCQAITNYHKLRKAQNVDWTIAKTASALHLSESEVRTKMGVAIEIDRDERVAAAPKYSVARGIVERNTARRKASEKEILIKEETGVSPTRAAPLLNESFIDWSASYSGPKFNFIHCDFPYGVKADNHNQGAAASFGGYTDTPETYYALLDALRDSMSNVVAESAHLMFWFSMDYYEYTRNRLNEMGWKVNNFPLIWYKSDGSSILPDPKRGPRRAYETCFMASRSDRFIIRATSNHVSFPNTKTIHMSEKPVGMLKKFMEMFVDEYTTILDPTCGSGNALKAAESLGATRSLGLEINTEFFNLAKENYYVTADPLTSL
jgi:ParB family chromosome partitioning protein